MKCKVFAINKMNITKSSTAYHFVHFFRLFLAKNIEKIKKTGKKRDGHCRQTTAW